MKEDKRQDNRYNKSDDFIARITNVHVKVDRSLVNRCPGFDISLVWSSRDC